VGNNLGISLRDRLLFTGDQLIIPKHNGLREQIFRLAHDMLGHFGSEKSYESLRHKFYWPNMRRDLFYGYISSCPECQKNKSQTSRPPGPLHPLSVPDGCFKSVAMDFVGPLPADNGFDCILTIMDHSRADIQLIPCCSDTDAEETARLFFDKWYCKNGCPEEIILDHDKIFMSRF